MSDDTKMQIDTFLAGAPHAVVGASGNREKYGNKALRSYLQAQRAVVAINPRAGVIEGCATFASLSDVPETLYGISVITPPKITELVIAEAIELGIRNIWLQPGAESKAALRIAERAGGINLIAGGPCILVVLGFSAAG